MLDEVDLLKKIFKQRSQNDDVGLGAIKKRNINGISFGSINNFNVHTLLDDDMMLSITTNYTHPKHLCVSNSRECRDKDEG
jgi:hypothetical protein